MLSRFPAAFRRPAFASWVILRPLGNCASLTVGRPGNNHLPGPHRGCPVAHEQDATGQGAPLTPRTAVRSRLAITTQPAPAAFQRPVPTAPLKHPIGGGNLHEASTGVHSHSPIPPATQTGYPMPGRRSDTDPPVFSLPVAPGWNENPWASSPSFAPRSHPRRTSRRRQAITHWPEYYTFDLSRTSNSASYLHSCTLRSHVVRCCLHHHPGHPQPGQPIRHRQQRPGHRRVGADLLHPPRPWPVTGHPDAAHHLGLPDIQCRDPRDDLLIVLRDFHEPHLHSTNRQGPGRPQQLQGKANLILVLEATMNGPYAQLPAPD
jgi:hypothetical protein